MRRGSVHERSIEVDEFIQAEEDAHQRLPGFGFDLVVRRSRRRCRLSRSGREELQALVDFLGSWAGEPTRAAQARSSAVAIVSRVRR